MQQLLDESRNKSMKMDILTLTWYFNFWRYPRIDNLHVLVVQIFYSFLQDAAMEKKLVFSSSKLNSFILFLETFQFHRYLNFLCLEFLSSNLTKLHSLLCFIWKSVRKVNIFYKTSFFNTFLQYFLKIMTLYITTKKTWYLHFYFSVVIYFSILNTISQVWKFIQYISSISLLL